MLLAPADYDRPDLLVYTVLFNNTSACPMGRYLFAPEPECRVAPPLSSPALFKTDLAKRVYAALERGDYTLAGLARHVNAPALDVHRVVQRLLRRDRIAVVDEVATDPAPGRHARVAVYGAR
jgi:hypothetical protein